MGAPRTGKTSFHVYCERIHILAGNPVIQLSGGKDDSFDALVAFVAEANPEYSARFINASDGWGVGYNPFRLPEGRSISAHASALAQYATPPSGDRFEARFPEEETAECFFAWLAVSQEPVWEAMRLFDFARRKDWLNLDLPEEYRYQQKSIASADVRSWEYKTGALRRFLRPFATSEAIRRLLSVSTPVEVAQLYDRGFSLFLKATPSNTLSPSAGQALLSFVLADLLRTGIENAGQKKKFRVYCDELQMFAPPQMGDILDTVLSSGFMFTVAHHHDRQFPDERLRESLKTSCGIKVIFGGLPARLRKELAEDSFPKELNTRHHKEPRYMQVRDYIEDEDVSITIHPDGRESKTTRPVRIPTWDTELVGYEDYTYQEVISKLAQRFVVPPRHCVVIFPDGRWQNMKIPTLEPYLPDSDVSLQFKESHDSPLERSGYDPPKRATRSARLHHAE